MLVDTHCHLADAAFEADRDAVITRARRADIRHIIAIADSVEGTSRARTLTAPGVSATAGVHPHEAHSWNDEAAAMIRDALDDPAVVAVGETGLDYHYDHSPRPAQRTAYAAQLALAADRVLPIVVHAREADEDMASMLREHGPSIPAVVLHSFSSGAAVFDAGLEIGAYFGWSGMVTFKNWRLADCVTACPADRLLLETDAPYLAPVPHRGTRNEPAYVRDIAARVAQTRATSMDVLAAETTENAVRCFGSRISQPLIETP